MNCIRRRLSTAAALTLSPLLSAIPTPAQASTIYFFTGGGLGHMFVGPDGERLPAGSLVRLGSLGIEGDIGSFREFGFTTLSDPGLAFPIGGFLTQPVWNIDPAANEAARDRQIYLWVYLGETPDDPGVLFTSLDESWRFPETFTGAADQTSIVILVPDAPVTAWLPTGEQLPSGVTRGLIEIDRFANVEGLIYHVAVPEPGAGALAVVPAAALALRRRNPARTQAK